MDSSGKLDALILALQNMEKEIKRDSLTGSNVSSCSETDDDEKPLSHAEESAIEECLNDTEGSLSNVDLNIFDEISDDLNVHRTRKRRGQRMSERTNMDFGENGTDYDSSLDEKEAFRTLNLAETSLNNPLSMNSKTGKFRSQAETDQIVINSKVVKVSQKRFLKIRKRFQDLRNSKLNTRVVRRKRKNSPPIRKNDGTHIYSFFSAMADLVSTFPENYVSKAKQNVNIILEEMVNKLKEWYSNEDPTNSTHGFDFNRFNYSLIQNKLARLQVIN